MHLVDVDLTFRQPRTLGQSISLWSPKGPDSNTNINETCEKLTHTPNTNAKLEQGIDSNPEEKTPHESSRQES